MLCCVVLYAVLCWLSAHVLMYVCLKLTSNFRPL